MKIQAYIKEKMLEKTISFRQLGALVGKKGGSVSDNLNRRDDIRTATAIELLTALDCELIARDRTTREETTITIE